MALQAAPVSTDECSIHLDSTSSDGGPGGLPPLHAIASDWLVRSPERKSPRSTAPVLLGAEVTSVSVSGGAAARGERDEQQSIMAGVRRPTSPVPGRRRLPEAQ